MGDGGGPGFCDNGFFVGPAAFSPFHHLPFLSSNPSQVLIPPMQNAGQDLPQNPMGFALASPSNEATFGAREKRGTLKGSFSLSSMLHTACAHARYPQG